MQQLASVSPNFVYDQTTININFGDQEVTIPTSYNLYYLYIAYGVYISDSNWDYILPSGGGKYSTGYGATGYTSIFLSDGSASFTGSVGYTATQSPARSAYSSIKLSSGVVYDSVPTTSSSDPYKFRFYITLSQTDLGNNSKNVIDAPGTISLYIEYDILNRVKNTYRYYLAFYDRSTLFSTQEVGSYLSRDEMSNPTSIRVSGAQNASQMGRTNPGYRGIGWDTSSSASTVVYGSKDYSGSFVIPAGVLDPDVANYKLYAVWEKSTNIKIRVGNEWKTVTNISFVQPDWSGDTGHLRPIFAGKIYDGNSWKDF